MKKLKLITTITMILAAYSSATAQLESILQLEVPTGLHIVNDTLYIATYEQEFLRYPLNSNQSPEILSQSNGFRFDEHDNNFYLSDSNNSILKYNLKDNSMTDFYEHDDFIAGVAIYEDDLYFSEWYDGEIRKIDLNNDFAFSEMFVQGLDTLNAMTQKDGVLYFIENRTNGIFKTDLTLDEIEVDTLFYGGFNSPNELYIHDDYMFVSEYYGNQISRFNIDEKDPSIEIVVENILSPTGLTSDDQYLYISSYNGDEIFRLPLSLLSSINGVINQESPLLYPNPTDGEITISELEGDETYKIYNNTGQLIQSGLIRNGEKIILKNKDDKYYFIQIGEFAITTIIVND